MNLFLVPSSMVIAACVGGPNVDVSIRVFAPRLGLAEVRALLYVLPPGTPVTISVQQPAGTRVVDVTLGTSS